MKRRYVYLAASVCVICVILGLFFLYVVPRLNIALNVDTNQIGSILTTIGIVSGIAFGLHNFVLTRKMAKEALKKAVLEVSVMGQRLIPDSEFSEIVFGYSVGKDDVVFCTIPFAIHNTGELSAENVSVRLTFPLWLRGLEGLMDNVEHGDIIGVYSASDLKRRAYKHEGFEIVDYLIPELGPHRTGVLLEPVDVTYSSALPPQEVHAVSKDEVPLTIKLHIPIVARVYVQVSAKDIKPASGHFRVKRFEAKNMKELRDKVEEDKINALKNVLEKMNDDTPASKMEKANLLKNTIAVMPKLNQAPKPNTGPQIKGTVFMEEPKQSIIDVLQTSESIRHGLRLPDGSTLIRNVSDDSILFRKTPSGVEQVRKKRKRHRNASV